MDIVDEARQVLKDSQDANGHNIDRAKGDLEFAILDDQWDENAKNVRGSDRPMLTINKLPAFIRQVTNDARQNKPSIKVHPADSGADVETAKIFDGLIRNIEYTSNADVAYDTGIEFAAAGGFGYWRVVTKYAYEDTFDLDLAIERIANPFTVHEDPYSTDADSADWNVALVDEVLRKSVFRNRYPKAQISNWNDEERSDGWMEEDGVRLAEFWKRTEYDKKLLMLSDGSVYSEDDFTAVDKNTGISPQMEAGASMLQVVRERVTKCHKVTQYIVNGKEVLEENEWMGKYIPIIPVYGEEVNINGKRYYYSLIHRAKDAQKMFNYWRTCSTELVALAPKAPYIGPKGAFNSDPNWDTANSKAHPYLEYDGNVPPQRQTFSGVPAGALQEALNSADDMKAILGLYDASLGAKSNETSGKAIIARQKEGDVSTFHFIDNLNRAIRHTGRVLIDLIPHVYDRERIVRVMGEDMTPQAVTVNQQVQQPDGSMKGVYDLRAGKYDLTVASGPSFSTRREEAANQMIELIRAFPAAAPVIGDKLAKNLDWPGAEDIAKDLEMLNPARQAEKAANQPPPDPMQNPEVMAKMAHTKAEIDGINAKSQANIFNMNAEAEVKRRIRMEEAGHEMQIKKDGWEHDKQRRNEEMTMEQDNEMGMPPRNMEEHPLMMLAKQIAQGNQIMVQGINNLTSAMVENTRAELAPKEIIRDATGRALGVKPMTVN